LNLIQSFKKRFNLTIDEEVTSLLTKKRKAPSTPTTDQSNKPSKKMKTPDQPKKLKTTDSNVSNGDDKQSVADCRQIPFKGIHVQA
jgi:hypothetical protein